MSHQEDLFSQQSAPSPEEKHVQHERRLTHLDKEVAGVKTEVAAVKTDVGVLQADVRTLAAGQTAMQESQDRGFRDLKETLDEKNKEPTKIGMGMLVSVLGLFLTAGVIGVGAFWAAILLLADPIQADLREHKAYTAGVPEDLALLRERSTHNEALITDSIQQLAEVTQDKHDEQQRQITENRGDLRSLFEWRLTAVERLSGLETETEWAHDDVEALKGDLREERSDWQRAFDSHMSEGNHPSGVVQQVSNLRSDVERLVSSVEAVQRRLDYLRLTDGTPGDKGGGN